MNDLFHGHFLLRSLSTFVFLSLSTLVTFHFGHFPLGHFPLWSLSTRHFPLWPLSTFLSLFTLVAFHFFVTFTFHKVTCQRCDKPTVRLISSSIIGTYSCYGSFERRNKTVQAKIVKICVGGSSCAGGAQNHLHQYDVLLHKHEKIAL